MCGKQSHSNKVTLIAFFDSTGMVMYQFFTMRSYTPSTIAVLSTLHRYTKAKRQAITENWALRREYANPHSTEFANELLEQTRYYNNNAPGLPELTGT